MKLTSILFGGLILFSVAWTPAASADEGPVNKLERGAVNIVTAPVEVIKQTRAYWIKGSQYTDHISFWLFSGMVKGVVETVKRAGSGVWDVLTFPLERPADYAPLLEPEYVFEEWPQRPPSSPAP